MLFCKLTCIQWFTCLILVTSVQAKAEISRDQISQTQLAQNDSTNAQVEALESNARSETRLDPEKDDTVWYPFDPGRDAFKDSPLDLRFLNESVAGENGFITAKDGQFIHSKSGKPVRFWAINGPPNSLQSTEDLDYCARLLAKYGVNLVRFHDPLFNKKGDVDKEKVLHALRIVESMKKAGIYTHFSIYFPLWFNPEPDNHFLKGYDGNQKPFATLYFNREFQMKYREWWRALLLTPNPDTGMKLIDDPSVLGLEMINEDSLFFWTFKASNLPKPQMDLLETLFADWLKDRFGSLKKTLTRWNQVSTPGDAPEAGRMGIRPLWNMFQEKTVRDKDTVAFLYEVQTGFYKETYQFLKGLGFKGLITASNWHTANEEILGPIEMMSYVESSDFLDRHGYFSSHHKGENAAWSIREGHTYWDRSALRFDPEEPGGARLFTHPVMDIQYNEKPSMISETTFNRPNRYRSEAPLYFAAYGSLQGSDALVHFAFELRPDTLYYLIEGQP